MGSYRVDDRSQPASRMGSGQAGLRGKCRLPYMQWVQSSAVYLKGNEDPELERWLSEQCLSHKHKDLSVPILCTQQKKTAVLYVCNPSTGAVETSSCLELPRKPVWNAEKAQGPAGGELWLEIRGARRTDIKHMWF